MPYAKLVDLAKVVEVLQVAVPSAKVVDLAKVAKVVEVVEVLPTAKAS